MIISDVLFGFLVFIYFKVTASELPPINMDSLGSLPSFKDKTVSSCSVCRNLAISFLKAVDETTRQSFAGGDADWEREKLGAYENSELRFIEIQEKLCSDITSGKDQCYNLAELHEEVLEDWFYKKRAQNLDLFQYLCINELKFCCPNNTYGPNCIPCPGGVEEPCGGHGRCMNGGTREQPGNCICNTGYTGVLCDECKHGYYQDKSSSSFSCKMCDKACKDYCRGPGPKNCEVCSDGYYFHEDEGCISEFDLNSSKATGDSLNDTENTKIGLDGRKEDVVPTATQSEHSEL
ncbi:protein disulfide isomerase Creld1-like isoform X1 [Argiope bruennichi]|uniref:protein disulfide isomerase Creld1-like isoform X1 n=2 Tax=Argiope bruennichi TaxID=94029 RepID=UPI002493FE0A|nr:protein disulfide isomerase Creld1-like isoform X1 [Argiope bruennichi]XP_055929455.1 protein disulfide isomerase Creld1-like isoform X1 [Argiope bruennichi]XP_055929456.1 protein disulfide isomerase Creld1-like isoform X1 [Argiope bruennichi]